MNSQGNNLEEEFNIYISCISEGVDLQYRRLGLYNLANVGRPNQWQVHSENSNQKFSQIYYNSKTAVEKFIEIKHKLDRNRPIQYEPSKRRN